MKRFRFTTKIEQFYKIMQSPNHKKQHIWKLNSFSLSVYYREHKNKGFIHLIIKTRKVFVTKKNLEKLLEK